MSKWSILGPSEFQPFVRVWVTACSGLAGLHAGEGALEGVSVFLNKPTPKTTQDPRRSSAELVRSSNSKPFLAGRSIIGRGYEMKIVLCCLLLAILFLPAQSIDQSAQSFRIIPIPTKEHGYNNFESIVFISPKDLDSFLTDSSTHIGWNSRQAFVDTLLNAKVDFSKEALVLLRHTEGSGSVKVAFETPVLQDRTLLCEIRGEPIPPGYGGTDDMAYYCFAVAVSKAHISQVELRAIQGGFSARPLAPIVLPVTEKTINENQISDCPTISVSCPDTGSRENKHIKFIASVTGDKPKSEISYKWSVTKGTITKGQGTAVIEVDAGVSIEGLTATVEVTGFKLSCNRFASCAMAIH